MLCGWQAGLVALWQLLLLCDRLILWLLLLTLRLRSGRFDVQIPLEATEGGAEREGKRRREGEKKNVAITITAVPLEDWLGEGKQVTPSIGGISTQAAI